MCMTTLPAQARARGFAPSLIAGLPSMLFDFFVARIAFRTYCDDVDADVPIWSTKLHVDPPRLAEGDGPIGRYRRWARQFYPELARSADDKESEAPAA
jgi:hypothetical protein